MSRPGGAGSAGGTAARNAPWKKRPRGPPDDEARRSSAGTGHGGSGHAGGGRAPIARGAVPAWSCACGAADNWGDRTKCRSCGRAAPDRTRRLQQEAAARKEPQPPRDRRARQNEKPADSRWALQDEVAQLRAELARAKGEQPPTTTGATSATEVVAGAGDGKTETEAERKLLDQIRRLEGALAAYGGSDAMAADRRRTEDRLQVLRSELHALWPIERRIKRAQRREEEARGRRDKHRAAEETAKQAVIEAQKVLDEAAGRARESEQQLEAALRELEALRPEAEEAKRALPTPAPAGWLADAAAVLAQGSADDKQLLAALRARMADARGEPAAKKAREDAFVELMAAPFGSSPPPSAGGPAGQDQPAGVAQEAPPENASTQSQAAWLEAGASAPDPDETMVDAVPELSADALQQACVQAGIEASAEQCRKLQTETRRVLKEKTRTTPY